MLAKTEAFVLQATKYGDNSVILKCYTQLEGLRTFIAGGLHSRKGVLKPSFIQPLTRLHVVYYLKGKSELKRVKEAGVLSPYHELPYDPVKSCLAMFLAEFLSHVIKEEESNESMFDFLVIELEKLDKMKSGLAKFHLAFLYSLSKFLGFAPESPQTGHDYFDLVNGVYTSQEPTHLHFLPPPHTQLWKQLHYHISEASTMDIGASKRDVLLQALLEFYRLHVNDFGELKSLRVLREVLH